MSFFSIWLWQSAGILSRSNAVESGLTSRAGFAYGRQNREGAGDIGDVGILGDIGDVLYIFRVLTRTGLKL